MSSAGRRVPIPAAIVFDFDGVLVNSEAAHGAALAAAGDLLGLTAPGDEPEWYIGLGDVECFQRMAVASGRRLTAEDLELLMRTKGRHFTEQCQRGCVEPYPGSVELMRDAARIAPVAICSGSRREEIVPILSRLGLASFPRASVTADDVTRTKPDPMPYRLVADRLGVQCAACIAIEDSPAGIASAVAAGYGAVHAVCHTFEATRLAQAHRIHRCTADLSAAVLCPPAA